MRHSTQYPCPTAKKETKHIYNIPKTEFMMRIGIGNKYNGLKYDVFGSEDDTEVRIEINVPAKNKNGNYCRQP